MATKAKTEEAALEAAEAKTEEVKDDRVEVFIPRGAKNDDPNFFVSVNGVNYLLPRGKKSKVPAAVAWEINRAFEAQELLDQRIDEMTGQ